jgi:SagB-type dehydrogenase family enzyme
MSLFFLFNFFHHETNDKLEKGAVKIPKDPQDWPEAWKRIEYKRYHLLKPVSLPQTSGVFFESMLSKRRSSVEYFSDNKPAASTLPMLSYVLRCGYGLQGCSKKESYRKENRTVPSAGKRYPLEMYIFLFKPIDSLQMGIYHYGIQAHTLEPVVRRAFTLEDRSSINPREYLHGATGMICVTGVFERTTDKYGSRGYRYILLEAGHVAQNILLAGTEKGINIIPIGGTNESVAERMIGLETLGEKVVYTLFF